MVIIMKKKQPQPRFDFQPLATAMRDARKSEGWTQDQAAEKLGVQQKYYQRIETSDTSHHPSLDLFYKAVRLFHISVDQYFFPNRKPVISTARRRLNALLDTMDEHELSFMESNARALLHLREARKNNE